jgi:PPOX class probable F420-dependent enzyme
VDPSTVRRRLDEAPVGRLATVTAQGRPHIVPCCFVLVGEVIYTAVDGKAKTTLALRRIENLRINPHAALVVDQYHDDWNTLWWVRVDGRGRVVDEVHERAEAIAHLRHKYPQYQAVPIPGPVLALDVEGLTAWP